MPLFEFVCNDCKEHFEMLVLKDNKIKCPTCKSINIIKQFSIFSTKSQNSGCFSSGSGLCQNRQITKHKCRNGCWHH
jgi:putative FmdB family regulatory protein